MNRLYPCSPRPSRVEERENLKSTSSILGNVIPQRKNEDHIRILLHNCSGIGAINGTNMSSSSDKLTQLKMFALSKQVDLIGITETNTDWRVIPSHQHLWKIVRP